MFNEPMRIQIKPTLYFTSSRGLLKRQACSMMFVEVNQHAVCSAASFSSLENRQWIAVASLEGLMSISLR